VAKEDITSYYEYDDASKVTVATNSVTVTDAQIKNEYYVSKDKGAAHFSGNFTHTVAGKVTAVNPYWRGSFWGLAKTAADDFADIEALSGDCLFATFFTFYIPFIGIMEVVAGTRYGDNYSPDPNLSLDTWYYFVIWRDERVGDYGTLNCRIYSDESRCNLLDTLSLALHEKEDFRFIFAANSWRSTMSKETYSAMFKDLDLHEGVTPDWYYTRKRRIA